MGKKASSAGATGTYSVAQLYAAARAAGFGPSQAVVATAISLAENGARDPHAIHRNANGTYDHGAWQINDANGDVIRQYGDVNNLLDNARMAHAIYKRQGWGAWSTFTSHAYTSHMTVAAAAGARTEAKAKVTARNTGRSPLQVLKDDAEAPLKFGQWFEQNALGGVLGGTSSGPLGDAISGTVSTGQFLAHLSDPALWRRVGIGAGAVLLLLVGVVVMLDSSKIVHTAVGTAGKAATL